MRCARQPEREAPCRPPKQSFGFFYYLYPIKFAMAEVGGVRKDSSSSSALPLAQRCAASLQNEEISFNNISYNGIF